MSAGCVLSHFVWVILSVLSGGVVRVTVTWKDPPQKELKQFTAQMSTERTKFTKGSFRRILLSK